MCDHRERKRFQHNYLLLSPTLELLVEEHRNYHVVICLHH